MKTVLIVDDQPGIRLLLEELFIHEQYNTQSAANGGQALRKVEENPPDCILLDMQMPGLDGIEVLKRIKVHWPEIPVIMMTANEELEKVEQAMDLGSVKYFTKPFDIFAVRDAVNNLLAG